MTGKRFWCLDEYKGETSPIVDGKFAPTNGWLCNKLNELHEENQALKHQRQESINEIAVIAIKYKALQDENTHFKNLIQEAYVNERTEMGKSVLKQLADNLGVELK